MSAPVSPAKRKLLELSAIRVLGAIQQEPGIELPQLHAQLHCQVPELRDALDTLRSQGRIYGDRTSTGRIQYFPRRGKPLAQAVELARATPEQLTGQDRPQAEPGSAAPVLEANPSPASDEVPTSSATEPNAAADFSGDTPDAPMVVRAGSIVCRVYQAMTASTAPITAQALARQLDVNTPAVAVSLSMLNGRGVVTYKAGAKKNIGGTYRLADKPRRVTIQHACLSARYARAAPAIEEVAATAERVAPLLAEATIQFNRLQEKLSLLDSLIASQPLNAGLLGEIRQDLSGVAA